MNNKYQHPKGMQKLEHQGFRNHNTSKEVIIFYYLWVNKEHYAPTISLLLLHQVQPFFLDLILPDLLFSLFRLY